jgi:diguanylate cyclase (GGDEF)-like protein/PAS domain S-box-containing protein
LDNLLKPTSSDEAGRLDALCRYNVLDTESEAGFDDLTRLAAQVCDTPIALITLLDARRQWFKSKIGVEISETPREFAFCRHALASRDVLVIHDMRDDPRFAENPFVAAEPHLCFYAGAPLVTPCGYVIGTICVLDLRPRKLSDNQISALQTLSRQVMALMETRCRLKELEQARIERTEDAAVLRRSEERFRGAFEDATIGMCLTDLEGRYLQVNHALCGLVGYTEEEMLGMHYQTITHPEDIDSGLEHFKQLLEGRTRSCAFEKRYLHRNARIIWTQTCISLVRDAEGLPAYAIVQIQDITQRRALEEEREMLLTQTEDLLAAALHYADRDPLTGLMNHRAFHKRFDEECEYAVQSGSPITIVMMDIDNFKYFNDAYGNLAGDDVLRRVAAILTQSVDVTHTVARFGGDEFILLLPNMGQEAAGGLVKQISDYLLNTGYWLEDSETSIPLALSVGIAAWPETSLTRLGALELADERLRRQKSGVDDAQVEMIRTEMGRSLEGFSMLDALVTAVDNKDRYTRRHSEDVVSYSLQIARELRLDEKMQNTIAVAALLHDVGKIGIPDRILRKPGRLTEEEVKAIRYHPTMGAVIVGAVPGLEETLNAVQHHHERWDGHGYPFGLKEEQTPLIARLMAVADAFSAMTTQRPYRQGMSHDKALKILEQGAGTQWDPECVDAFLRARRSLGPGNRTMPA